MKNLKHFLLFAPCIAAFSAFAGEANSSNLRAEKICSPAIDIFDAKNVESILNLPEGKKVSSCNIILCTNSDAGVFKYEWSNDGSYNHSFKVVMERIKKNAVSGSMLFFDEIKTSDRGTFAQTVFYLRP